MDDVYKRRSNHYSQYESQRDGVAKEVVIADVQSQQEHHLSEHDQSQTQQLVSHRSNPTNSGDLQTISADVTPRIRPNTELTTPRTNAAR